MSEQAKCELCGEPMPEGEQMFKFHGYSGPCPKPPLAKSKQQELKRIVNNVTGLSNDFSTLFFPVSDSMKPDTKWLFIEAKEALLESVKKLERAKAVWLEEQEAGK